MANKSLYVHNGLAVGSSVTINGSSGNISTTGIVTSTNVTNATSTITGALQIAGGVGIGRDLWVGGTIYGNINTDVSSATTIASISRTTGAAHYLTFVDSNNDSSTYESVYTTSSFTVNPGTGNVGIGTSAPADRLHIEGNLYFGTSTRTIFTGGAGDLRLQAGTTGNLVFNTAAGTERMRINSSGDLLVGTTTANGKVSIVGDQLSIASSSGSGSLGLQIKGTALTAIPAAQVQGYIATGDSAIGIAGDLLIAPRTSATASIRFITGTTPAERIRIDASGNVGIGTTSPTYKLEVNGSFAATTKSFVINHPTKPGMKLRYGSLEGPENGVYVRGRLKGSNKIELPDYWTGLVDEETITVNLTPIGKHQKLYVEDIVDNIVIVGNDNLLNKEINCFYTVFAERKDVDKLDVEI